MTDEQPGEQYIEYIRLDDLIPAKRNSRVHALDDLTGAVTGLGFTTELKLDENTGELIRGHGRLAALRRLRDRGADAPEWVRDDGDDWSVPVVRGWRSRGGHHADAVREADNHQGELGGYDPQVQLAVLSDVATDSPNMLRATGWTSDRVEQLLQQVSGGTLVTDLDKLTSGAASLRPDDAAAPWDRDDADPFARTAPPDRDDDEQWDPGQTIVEPERRSEPPEPDGPGPLDVSPAWRTLQPWRAVFHAGGPDGARAVMDWLKGHAAGIRVEDGDVVLWDSADGPFTLLPGQWLTRDGQTGRFDVWTDAEFGERFVPANEPARRVMRDAANSRVNARVK